MDLFVLFVFYGFSVAPTPLGLYGDFQLLLMEEDPTHTNVFASMGRTNDAPQVSWKTSPNESFRPDRDLNLRVEGNQRFRPFDHGLWTNGFGEC